MLDFFCNDSPRYPEPQSVIQSTQENEIIFCDECSLDT